MLQMDKETRKKEKSKQYYHDNKEKLKLYNIQYRQENRQAILERRKKKVYCSCGKFTSKDNLAKHKRTNIHKKWELSIEK